jgi:SAM-dependent methyltransferase
MKCRICGSDQVAVVGDVEFFSGYAFPIFDCGDCGCRFTRHDNAAYERLYAEAGSCYSRYLGLAERCKAHFDRADLAGLRFELSKAAKYRLIIEELDRRSSGAQLLEVGCSRGHLTSYFILAGCAVTGVDVSPSAVTAAATAFGDHFVIAGDPAIEAGAPYDAIYHVGMIGCVADPIGMTRRLLNLLKPGGRLVFNVPNRESCHLRGQLWIDSAPPPDLVTLFPPGFWRRHFDPTAEVSEEVEFHPPERAVVIGLQKLARLHWCRPVAVPLSEGEREHTASLAHGETFWRALERLLRRIGKMPALSYLAPRCPTEFGLFVRMTKKEVIGARHYQRDSSYAVGGELAVT